VRADARLFLHRNKIIARPFRGPPGIAYCIQPRETLPLIFISAFLRYHIGQFSTQVCARHQPGGMVLKVPPITTYSYSSVSRLSRKTHGLLRLTVPSLIILTLKSLNNTLECSLGNLPPHTTTWDDHQKRNCRVRVFSLLRYALQIVRRYASRWHGRVVVRNP
jgi:hypothetical protein